MIPSPIGPLRCVRVNEGDSIKCTHSFALFNISVLLTFFFLWKTLSNELRFVLGLLPFPEFHHDFFKS